MCRTQKITFRTYVATGSEHHLIVQIHSASAVLLKTIVHILKAVRRDIRSLTTAINRRLFKIFDVVFKSCFSDYLKASVWDSLAWFRIVIIVAVAGSSENEMIFHLEDDSHHNHINEHVVGAPAVNSVAGSHRPSHHGSITKSALERSKLFVSCLLLSSCSLHELLSTVFTFRMIFTFF